MNGLRLRRALPLVALLAAMSACEKTGDALLVISVRSATRMEVKTFNVTISTIPEAGSPQQAQLTYALADGGTVSISSMMPTVLGATISAEHGQVDVQVVAIDDADRVASGRASMIALRAGEHSPVDITLGPGEPADGGVDGGGDAGAPDGAADAADGAEVGGAVAVDRSWAQWPMPNNAKDVAAGAPYVPNVASYTEKDLTIKDAVTGLTWQKGVAPGLVGADGNPSGLLGQIQAADYCQKLVLGGHDDWRVPTLIELVSIVDDSGSNPSLNAIFTTPASASPYFWSATPLAGSPADAWRVSFLEGFLKSGPKVDPLHVRCVHSEPVPPPARRYEVQGTTVFDNKTGLTWQRAAAPTTMSWANAKKHCANISAPWRLPTKNELLTLVDYSKPKPTIDTNAFPDALGGAFWSSTPIFDDAPSAWEVDFDSGTPRYFMQATSYSVRCVR